ncbi:LLM class flavin-dependent oxidoreductase [Streptomyces sp. NPDC013171]|uniref:LLM class flavin-dependent oxidoreductase n=1 Tax=Streptomyces sp. NPDC013171 TaxID=3364863 RepID=UPI003680CBB1
MCGIGRGDSAMRVAGRKPNTLARLGEAIEVIRDLVEGREATVDGNPIRIPWIKDGKLPVWMAAYGPRALALAGEKADGFILQLADPFLTEWMVKAVRQAATDAGRDPDALTICVAAPAYVTADDSPAALAHARDQCRHGRADNPDTAFVPDEIVDRFCLLGPAEAHIAKLRRLKDLGVDQFAVYDMHDDREGTIDAYGTEIIPALG